MLIFCAQRSLSVPQESGVEFGISKEARSDTLCLLFKIDRGGDELLTGDNQLRPDYLALYKTPSTCVFTIVEMKGRAKSSLEHGLEQIVFLRDRLKREFSEHCPLAANATYQGILLCPYGSQPPNERIRKISEESNGSFRIVPLLYQYKAELFPYISKRNALTDRYTHQSLPHSNELTYLERLIVHQALPDREPDAQYHSQYRPGSNTGLYINYALSDEREYAAFIANEAGNKVVVKAEGSTYLQAIQQALADVGWERKIRCSKLTTEAVRG